MQTVLILIGLIAAIVVLASVVPVSQCVYYKFFKKNEIDHRYLFSEDLFDRHTSYDIGLSDVRVIHNRNEMEELMKQEMARKLP